MAPPGHEHAQRAGLGGATHAATVAGLPLFGLSGRKGMQQDHTGQGHPSISPRLAAVCQQIRGFGEV
jgi:hypothetical protein